MTDCAKRLQWTGNVMFTKRSHIYFNSHKCWIHEEEIYEECDDGYIKLNVSIEFIPFIGKLVQNWPSIYTIENLKKFGLRWSLSSKL